MLFDGHAPLFCLNGVFDLDVGLIPQYTPTEDISLAEQHLNTVPVELVHMHKVQYHIALSDLNRWKGNKGVPENTLK